ncbi:MAG: O-antigen ligase family protein [Clostridiales bacterium]|nr:O-antigen ligase family protein [Clostridiales bacterium]
MGGFFGAQFSFTMGLAIVIGIIISALIFYNTYFGIFVIVFSTPILPTKIILFICAICAVSFCLKISNENIKINFKETEFLIIVFLFLTLISSVTSFFKLNSIKILGMRIILISSYFILANLIKNKNLLLNVLKTITFSALLVSLYGILQYFLKIENSNSWLDKEMFKNISVRVYSTLSNPNVLGEYLNLVFFIPICMFFIEKNKLMKLFYISSAVLIFFALILTFSRGSWVGLLISFLICVLILDKRILIILTVLFIISTLFIPNFIFERFLSIGNISDTSTLYRVYIWFGTFKMLKNFWLFGIGPSEKNFNFVYSNYQYNGITAPHSHNTFLQIFVESGIVNLIIFIILLLFFFRKIIISSKQSCIKSQHFLINLAIGESVLAFCLNGLFDDAFYNHKVSTMFWIIIAIGLANCSIIENKTLNGGEFE